MVRCRGWLAFLIAICSAAPGASGQQTGPDAQSVTAAVRQYREANAAEILGELRTLLSLPNVARDAANIRRNAEHLVRLLEARGAIASILEAEGSPPAVYGELTAPEASRTVVFYAHYDGQPVDETRWASEPWAPILRDGMLENGAGELPWDTVAVDIDPEWRIYARSASDDKSPIVAMLRAIDALRAADLPLSINLKFFFEGEEEAGSSHLAWIFGDGPVHQTRQQQVVFGARGVMGLGITVYGPSRVLHSGHYGNWAPNPAVMLVDLIASMRNTDGDILIEGFYDDVRPPSDVERQAIAGTPDVERQLTEELALGRTEGGNRRLLDRIMLPAMNVDGLAAGNVGVRARNAIPAQAQAAIDIRMVPDQRPARVRELVERHVRARGFHVVYEEPDMETRRAHAKLARLAWGGGYPAVRTSMDLEVSRAIMDVVDQATATPLVRVPMLGGSLPLFVFEQTLGVPLVIVPIVNHDNNQHAPNENLRVQNLWDGIEVYAGLMARLGYRWGAAMMPDR
jgi:acetylornithine deacetylase/succinyl-diaminopimelate desuccinylase-like protein